MAKQSQETAPATEAAPTHKEIIIQGLKFSVAVPYTEGHVITGAEAAALNQTRTENIRNNAAKFVKAALEKAGTDEEGNQIPLDDEAMEFLVDEVSTYDNAYEFTLASVGGGRQSTDPVDKEATRMARSLVSEEIRKAGKKIADFDKDQLAAVIAQTAANPDVRAAAVEAVKQRQALAAASLSALDLS